MDCVYILVEYSEQAELASDMYSTNHGVFSTMEEAIKYVQNIKNSIKCRDPYTFEMPEEEREELKENDKIFYNYIQDTIINFEKAFEDLKEWDGKTTYEINLEGTVQVVGIKIEEMTINPKYT